MRKIGVLVILLLLIDLVNAQSVKSLNDSSAFQKEPEAYEMEKLSQTSPIWRNRRFEISAGLFFPLNNTEISVGSNSRDFGTTIDLEDDLGFDKYSFSFLAYAQWRISKRSRLTVENFYLNRKSRYVLDKEIEFGDNIYPVSASVEAFFDMNILRLYYSYGIVVRPKFEFGALIGSHVLFTDVGLRAEANAVQAELKDNFDFIAPVPDLGLWFEMQLSKRFGLYANANYLALKIDNIKGRIFSSNLFLTYNVYKNWSIKGGFTSLNFKVDVAKERLDGYLKWGYNGPTISLNYTFGNQLSF